MSFSAQQRPGFIRNRETPCFFIFRTSAHRGPQPGWIPGGRRTGDLR